MEITVTSTSKPAEEAQSEAKAAPVTPVDKALDDSKSASAVTADETTETSDSSADENDGTEEGEKSIEEKPRKKTGVQKRIDKLRAKATAAETERDLMRAKLATYEKTELEKHTKPVAETVEADPNAEPDPEKFENHTEYIRAVTKWEITQSKKADEVRARETQLKTEVQKQHEVLVASIEKFAKEVPDWEKAIESVEDIDISLPVQEAIRAAGEDGPKLMYALAKDREEYKRICALDGSEAWRAIGKFEAKLQANPAPSETKPELKTTKASKPISPVGGRGPAVGKSIDDPSLSQKEYEAIRREQMARAA